jgi:hypothetical protein
MWQSCATTIFAIIYTRQSCACAIFAIYHMRQSCDSAYFALITRGKAAPPPFAKHAAKLHIRQFCNISHAAKLCLCYLQIYTRCKAAPPQMYTPGKAAPPPFAKCIHAAKPRIRHFCISLHVGKLRISHFHSLAKLRIRCLQYKLNGEVAGLI